MKQGLSLNLELAVLVGLADQQVPRICLSPPGLQACAFTCLAFMWLSGILTQALMLCKHFIRCTPPQPSLGVSFVFQTPRLSIVPVGIVTFFFI